MARLSTLLSMSALCLLLEMSVARRISPEFRPQTKNIRPEASPGENAGLVEQAPAAAPQSFMSTCFSKLLLAAELTTANKHFLLVILETLGTVILVTLAVLVGLLLITPCWLGPALKRLIEELDKEIIGVDITAGTISVNPCAGKVEINDLKVCNPPGYQADHMLTMDKLILDLNMRRLIKSAIAAKFKGKRMEVTVEEFLFEHCHVLVEKHSITYSNVKEVLNFLQKKKKDKPQTHGGAGASSGSTQNEQEKEKAEKEKKKPKVTVQKVKIKKVDIRFQIETHSIFGHEKQHGVDLALADIVDDDFSKHAGDSMVDDVIQEILKTLLKSVVTNIAGRHIGNHVF
mmetsp:Transcript_125690/g.218002  ORF Transcript_125690/g.218002 Transcript_125690/m.218002 type:complete len:345 (-) Transcript_125690:289-1323(-)